MINLLTTLFQTLSQAHGAVYFEEAPSSAVYPYAVFKLPNSLEIESDRQDFILEIDVWDDSADTTRLEQLTDALDKQLYKLRHLDTNYCLLFQRTNRLMLPDPDLKRRQLRYLIKTYERVN